VHGGQPPARDRWSRPPFHHTLIFAFRGCCRPRRARPAARRGRSNAHLHRYRRNRRSAPPCSSALGIWSGRLPLRARRLDHRGSAGRYDRHGGVVAAWRVGAHRTVMTFLCGFKPRRRPQAASGTEPFQYDRSGAHATNQPPSFESNHCLRGSERVCVDFAHVMAVLDKGHR
jgi:hypothetical protein